MPLASLPMYDLPELRAATDAWWAGLATEFRRAGVDAVPDRLTRSPDPQDDWGDPDLLFSQTCGFPLTHAFAGRLTPLATPCHAAPGCDGPLYRSAVVARADRPDRTIGGFRGAVAAVNGFESQSGWNALAALVSPLADASGAFFGAVRVTGSHAASLAALTEGVADIAAVDCVTLALLARHRPAAVAGLVRVAWTDAAPALPYVTRSDAHPDLVGRLKAGLAAAMEDPALADARAALLIAGHRAATMADYRPIREMAAGAAAVTRRHTLPAATVQKPRGGSSPAR
ncbi:MAG: phosphate/phosphite/phosphonate ABC transporter substrate-binding protein [Inquilinaceae bacterium]